MALDWLEPTKCVNYKYDATILVLPGLTGDSKCEYVRATSLAIQKSGFRIVVFNYRGIGGIELKVLKIIMNYLSINIYIHTHILMYGW